MLRRTSPLFKMSDTPASLDAFISYARADKSFVRPLTEALEQLGRGVWIDLDAIPAGARWSDELVTAIEAAVAFVFVVSPESVASKHCQREVDHAVALGERLSPVILRKAALPAALEAIQWIDAGTPDATATHVSTAID